MKLSIKNMVCPRCVESVTEIANRSLIDIQQVGLGFVEVESPLTEPQKKIFSEQLRLKGFELITDRESELVNIVKSLLIEYIEEVEKSKSLPKLSEYISNKSHYNYSYLSHIFSERTGKTVEKLFIELRIERVKELLQMHKWTLSEIAWKMNYSSVQYLSNQFKKITGSTVTEYLNSKRVSRRMLDEV